MAQLSVKTGGLATFVLFEGIFLFFCPSYFFGNGFKFTIVFSSDFVFVSLICLLQRVPNLFFMFLCNSVNGNIYKILKKIPLNILLKRHVSACH